MISYEQADNYVHDTNDFYDALQRCGFRLPNKKSKLCTLKFLHEVRAKQVWVPTLDILVVRNCPKPPTIEVIKKELVDSINANYANIHDPALVPAFARLA